MRIGRLLLLASVGAIGCFPNSQRQPDPPDPMRVKVDKPLVQANVRACTRVDSVGQRILSANRELPPRLIFRTAGLAKPELFHQNTTSVVITQKLVEMCKTDGELAAVLAMELAKMVVEREALAPFEANQSPPKAPIEPVTFRHEGGLANPDPERLRELAKYEEDLRRQAGKPALPNANELAKKYLHRAGYKAEELDRVKPFLREAAENSDLQSQFLSSPRIGGFSPPGGQ